MATGIVWIRYATVICLSRSGKKTNLHGRCGDDMSTFWSGKRVFITGITGFVGYWLAERLIEKGADVIGLVRE